MKIQSRFLAGLLLISAISGLIWSQRGFTTSGQTAGTLAGPTVRSEHKAIAARPAIFPVATPTAAPAIVLGAQETRDWRDFAPEHFTVQLTPELAVPFQVTKVRHDAHGRTVLRARIDKAATEASGMDGAFLVSTASTPNRWDAVVVLPGDDHQYNVVVLNGVSTVTRVSTKFTCAEADLPAAVQQALPVKAMVQASAVGTPNVVNVLFIASANTTNFYRFYLSTTQLDSDCSNYIEAANTILENSLISVFSWNYIGWIEAPTTIPNETVSASLTSMASGDLSLFIASAATTVLADQIVYLNGEAGSSLNETYSGLAFIGGSSVSSGGDAIPILNQLNYSVVKDPICASDAFSPGPGFVPESVMIPVTVVAHELGHNFGCNHDRATMNATPGDGRYNYGYSFIDNFTNPSTGQPFSQQYGTVMSYNGLTLPYYSNPNATWYNENQTPYALGVAINLPLAADNALVMTNAAPAMAATHLGGIPAITQQPQSATVQMGGSFTLSTAATGNSLKYQWFKNSTAIFGATGSSYGITGAATGDAGSYTVTVSNLAGSATSSAATVTVNSGSGGGGGGSSGGGGGGGALSEWFFVALGLLALARRAMGKR